MLAPAAGLPTGCQDGGMQGCELLIADGTVVDGSAERRFEGAVGVTAATAQGTSRIAVLRDPDEIEAARSAAGRVIDAHGKVVAPGFIDLHSHAGLTILAEPLHEPKVRQGVTTEVIGVDGNAYAPFERPDDLAAFVEL